MIRRVCAWCAALMLAGLFAADGPLPVPGAPVGAPDALAAPSKTKRDSAQARRLYRRGLAYYQEGRYVEALRSFQHSTFSGVELTDAFFGQGLCLVRLGAPDQAKGMFERAIAQDARHAPAHYNLALAELQLGDSTRVRERLEHAAGIDTSLPGVHLALSRLSQREGRLADAEREARLEVASQPDSATVHGHLGHVLLDAGHADSAVTRLNVALELNASLIEARLQRARALGRLERHTEAADDFQAVLRADSSRADVWAALGAEFIRAGEPGAAIDAFTRATVLDTTDARSTFNLGLALDGAGHPEEALEAYRLSIERDPLYPEPHLNAGALLARLGRYGEARPALERYLELAPDSDRADEIRTAIAQLPREGRARR